jgi:hypothetical protein
MKKLTIYICTNLVYNYSVDEFIEGIMRSYSEMMEAIDNPDKYGSLTDEELHLLLEHLTKIYNLMRSLKRPKYILFTLDVSRTIETLEGFKAVRKRSRTCQET